MSILTKGTDIFDSLLLEQYQNSVNLKEYMYAFIKELDELFKTIDDVYYGRFINQAVGKQLDIIGEILQQSRAVELSPIYFGFEGAANVNGFASEELPNFGGLFKDQDVGSSALTPLDDLTYRRLLLAKALVLNSDSCDINLVYEVVTTILGEVPNFIEIEGADPVVLRLSEQRTDREIQLINYMAKYFVPLGTSFAIVRI